MLNIIKVNFDNGFHSEVVLWSVVGRHLAFKISLLLDFEHFIANLFDTHIIIMSIRVREKLARRQTRVTPRDAWFFCAFVLLSLVSPNDQILY